ncbi:hypothetical protein F8271_22370 [Micromonospora sp. ALFpr18c]|uniref:hypothetical protein n=1 Tax=unclassified Micromonospora TaxID=2617518 RepID=UPI00124B6B46|nr:hypothetical protein [Micromonospora sp. ALFpr18c]KAB1934901.1 hypothetical protein F8271_22370 [Micromonospora sp. ALFpr18c]
MNALIASLGGKLAERWLAGLALPGVVFVAVAAAAVRLGHAHWWDLRLLRQEVERLALGAPARGTGSALLIVLGVVLASVVAAMAAQSLERLVVAFWTQDWGRVGDAVTRRRRRRWNAAMDRYETALRDKARRLRSGDAAGPLPDTQALARACDRIALTEPDRPTWIGDRMLATAVRVRARYGLDLAAAWPRLWLLLPEETRDPLALAQADFAAAARRVGWGLLYLALGLLWWPAVILGLGLCVVGWRRGRSTVSVLADLVEAVVDLHVRTLGAALGHPTDGTFGTADGEALTVLLRKDR